MLDFIGTELRTIAKENKKILYYPSCWQDVSWLDVPAMDVVVLSDYRPRDRKERSSLYHRIRSLMPEKVTLVRSLTGARIFDVGSKRVFLFFRDNNQVVRWLTQTGNTLSYFWAVCDGCMEGGNYECVNQPRFLKKIFAIQNREGMVYASDHLFGVGTGWKGDTTFEGVNFKNLETRLDRLGRKVSQCRVMREDAVEEKSLFGGDSDLRIERKERRPRMLACVFPNELEEDSLFETKND